MKRIMMVLALVFAAALLPTAVFAAEGENEDDFMFKTGGRVHIPAGESIGTLMVIDADVQIDGTVRERLILIDARTVVAGQVNGTTTVIEGSLALEPTAQVRNIDLISASLTQSTGAVINGNINEREQLVFSGFGFILGAFIWSGMTIAIVTGGALFALVASGQLRKASGLLTGEPAMTVVAALCFWVAAPIAAVLLMLTLVGFPLGIGLVAALPIVWVLGYIVSGYKLGTWLAAAVGRKNSDNVVLPVIAGLLVLQVLVLLPVLGATIAAVTGFWGAGSLVLTAWRSVQKPQPMATIAA